LCHGGRAGDAFYEWRVVEGGKQPYAITRQHGQPMAFADLLPWFGPPAPAASQAALYLRLSARWIADSTTSPR
jgi:putative SOS response-associated peptidase YedK